MKKFTSNINYLAVFYLLAISGNPYLNENSELAGLMSLVFTIPFLMQQPKVILNKKFLGIILFFIGFEVMHSVYYELDYSRTIIKILLGYLFAYCLILRLRGKFIDYFINTMVIISLISLVFFVLTLSPGINKILFETADKLLPLESAENGYRTPTFLIYTFHYGYYIGTVPYPRNAGIWWEAGAFGVFLGLSYFLHLIQKKPLVIKDMFDKKSIIFIVTMLTTTSTTTFLAFALILIVFTFGMKGFYKIALIILILPVMYISFTKLPFLQEKIEAQLDDAESSNNRFGSVLLDWQDIKKQPLIGWSRRREVLFGDDMLAAHRPNGITNVIRSYGFIYFVVYLLLLYFSFRKITEFYNMPKRLALVGVILILLLVFSQLYLDKPFFRSFVFLSITYGYLIRYKQLVARNTNHVFKTK